MLAHLYAKCWLSVAHAVTHSNGKEKTGFHYKYVQKGDEGRVGRWKNPIFGAFAMVFNFLFFPTFISHQYLHSSYMWLPKYYFFFNIFLYLFWSVCPTLCLFFLLPKFPHSCLFTSNRKYFLIRWSDLPAAPTDSISTKVFFCVVMRRAAPWGKDRNINQWTKLE